MCLSSTNSAARAAGRLLAALLFVCGSVAGAPYKPASDDAVLATLPFSSPANARQRVGSTSNLPDLIAQAIEDLEMARNSGDPRYLGYAQATLGSWWTMADPPTDVALVRAQIHQHNHHFPAALSDLGKVLARDPRNAQALLTRAAIQQVRGNYAAADIDCRRLVLLASALTTADCLNQVASLRGHARTAYQKQLALRDRHMSLDDRERREIELTLADIATRLGNTGAARDHYTAALRAGEPDAYTLATFADFLLDQREFAAAINLAREYSSHQDLLLRAALAAKGTGVGADLAGEVRSQYAAFRRRDDFVPSRDYARFLLDIEADAPAALQAALFNWRSQREPADARIVLRAALASHQPELAAPVISFIEANKLEDVRLQELIRQFGSGS
jgi:Tfp pilus assembly protein PilF